LKGASKAHEGWERCPGLPELRRKLQALGTVQRAAVSRSFFKTGPGQYGEGDRFLGVTVPDTRRLAREAGDLPLARVLTLLRSPIHEERLLALLILVRRYERGDPMERREVYNLYLANTECVNNWDLVDLSAPNIVGEQLGNRRSRRILYRLAKSNDLWERRIAILATLPFIRNSDFADALAIAEALLRDEHDLIHKAVGWMLREVGKRDQETLEGFLRIHGAQMPRTTLRYAIERFPEPLRRAYLKGNP
jgi:3-methyladenine DNA glycosylase AlkD